MFWDGDLCVKRLLEESKYDFQINKEKKIDNKLTEIVSLHLGKRKYVRGHFIKHA